MFNIQSNNNDAKSIMGIPISMTGMTSGMTLIFNGQNFSPELNNGLGVVLSNDGTALIPVSNQLTLGNSDNPFKDLFVTANSLHIGTAILTENENGGINLPTGTTISATNIYVNSTESIQPFAGEDSMIKLEWY